MRGKQEAWETNIHPVVAMLKERRLELGLTQTELAQKTGLSQFIIHAVETGRTEGSIRNLAKIADALGCVLTIRFKKKAS